MKTINKNKAKELIYKSNGSIFSTLFIKKNGEHRLLTGRTKVKKYLKDDPKPPPFEPSKYNLIPVFIRISDKFALSVSGWNFAKYNLSSVPFPPK